MVPHAGPWWAAFRRPAGRGIFRNRTVARSRPVEQPTTPPVDIRARRPGGPPPARRQAPRGRRVTSATTPQLATAQPPLLKETLHTPAAAPGTGVRGRPPAPHAPAGD